MTVDVAQTTAVEVRSDNKLVIRTKDSVSTICDVVTNNKNDEVQLVPLIKVSNSTLTCCSPNGLHVFFQTLDEGIVRHSVITTSPEDSRFSLTDSKAIQYVAFSPVGSYLVTFERPGRPINDLTVPNVKIWDALTGEVIYEKFYKAFSKSSWPYIRWSNDEQYCLVLSSAAAKEIQVYQKVQFQSCIQKIKGLTEDPIVSFSIAPSFEQDKDAVVFHTFSPGTKGQPSKFAILRYPDRLGQSPIVVKSFFQAEEVTVKWNSRGDAALVLTQTSVDTTGDSYYGSTQLHLFLIDDTSGSSTNNSIQVPLVKTGPVSSVEWCPDSTRKKAPTFLAISGKMPALAALYNGRTGEPIYVFGEQHRNTISWSPSGRFVCLAGFGNLAGGMDFWDINKRKKVPQYHPSGKDDELLVSYGNTAKPAGSFGWSPDSRLFHVSTMAPRMNVDNGVRIYKYNGDGPICDYPLLPDQLHFAEFVPPRLGEPLVDRPQSPPPFRNAKLVEVQRQEGTSTRLKDAATSSTTTPQAYIPPSARQRLSSGSLAERLRKEKETLTVGAGKIATIQKSAKPSSIVTGRSIPGMAPLNNGKGSSSNSTKKAKSKRPTSEAKKEVEERKKTEAIEQKDEAINVAEPSIDADKRIKKINKLLKQIEELKAGDQSKLNDDQRKKIGNESILLEELKALEISK